MNHTDRLFVALHALVHLDRAPEPLTSDALAACLHSNPVVVRRTLAPLRDAGLVGSARGPGGGWSLSRAAADISLREICAALGEGLVDLLAEARTPPTCPIVRTVSDAMSSVLVELRALVEERLGAITLADLSASVPTSRSSHGTHPEVHHHAR